jgi:hypothetical protein
VWGEERAGSGERTKLGRIENLSLRVFVSSCETFLRSFVAERVP